MNALYLGQEVKVIDRDGVTDKDDAQIQIELADGGTLWIPEWQVEYITD